MSAEKITSRKMVVDELTALGLTNRQIAGMCGVDNPNTVTGWRNRGTSPGMVVSQKALDRLGKVVSHLRVNLSLEDGEIKDFLTKEPTRTKPYDLDELWTEEDAQADRIPLANQISDRDGLVMIAERILDRYFEVQLEGNYSLPQTYVYHLIDA